MIMSVRFDLSYELLNATLSVYFNENLHFWNGRRHDITCSHRTCYVTCGHNIIYYILSNEIQEILIKNNVYLKKLYFMA